MSTIEDFLSFLNQSPTAWHAVRCAAERLKAAGFTELSEQTAWSLQNGRGYFVLRNGSSLCAFVTPENLPTHVRLIGSHSDSPALKLKPKPEFHRENMLMFGVEVYGAPLLSSWLNRDLGLAGRIVYQDCQDNILEALVNLKKHPLVIPQLAIHLDRNVNEQGLLLNKQEHLSALAALANGTKLTKDSYLQTLLEEELGSLNLLAHDLFLVPIEEARFMGYEKQMIASYRIDNLSSVHASLMALVQNKTPHSSMLKMITFWDNEEIGSETAQGAASPFVSHTTERIVYALNGQRENYLRLISQSLCVSVDLAHALHPNYLEKHEPRHQPILGKGIVLKYNAQQRYASDARTSAVIASLCQEAKLPLQKFVARSDMPCGSTIGPIHAHLTGMPTVDIGSPQLSMHSARELMACQDHLDMCELLASVLT